MTAVEKVAARIVEKSQNKPADAVLRTELKASRLSRRESGDVAALVFSYFRWQGWQEPDSGLPRRFQVARDLEIRFRQEPEGFSDQELQRAVPAWALTEVSSERSWLLALQTPPTLWLRAKRGTGRDLAQRLVDCKQGEAELTDCLEYLGETDLFRSPEFQSGAFEVQDISSQWVGLLCQPQPGETWWDACAGEGGKMLHLSDLMQNKGLIWASDRSEQRLLRLKQRAARAQAFNYRTAPWDGSAKLPTKTKFDGVLIDAPCSGVGTWQRNPHARWTTSKRDVDELAALQRELVKHAAAAVKPGGRLIYAVCTLTRSETVELADLCSPELPGFAPHPLPASPNEPPKASALKWFWPQTTRGNGMFVVSWRRLP